MLLSYVVREGGRTGTRHSGYQPRTLAGPAGTTWSKVSFFINKFRKIYNGGIKVHGSLLNIVLHQ